MDTPRLYSLSSTEISVKDFASAANRSRPFEPKKMIRRLGVCEDLPKHVKVDFVERGRSGQIDLIRCHRGVTCSGHLGFAAVFSEHNISTIRRGIGACARVPIGRHCILLEIISDGRDRTAARK